MRCKDPKSAQYLHDIIAHKDIHISISRNRQIKRENERFEFIEKN